MSGARVRVNNVAEFGWNKAALSVHESGSFHI